MKKRILFYCQSLLGIGHFIRSRELLFALRDFDVWFLYGGEAVPGFAWPDWVKVIYLPALRSDAAFEQLYVVAGEQTLAEVKAQRRALLLEAFAACAPDVLLIELFPFGRKKFQFELLPLLERARSSCKVVCSLRDILVTRAQQTKYEAEVVALMNQYFDLLLVHADPRVQRLEESFGSVAQLRCPVRYTGYVAQLSEPAPSLASPLSATQRDNREAVAGNRADAPLILVSIGGGRVGHELIFAAQEAAAQLTMPYRMQMFAGPHVPAEVFAQMQTRAAALPAVQIARHTTEFPAWLGRAALSLSMAGYNTCMDLLAAGARALVYPFREHDNDEQVRRAEKLAQLGLVRLVQPEQLAAPALASLITQALREPRATPAFELNLQGAPRTATLLHELLNAPKPA